MLPLFIFGAGLLIGVSSAAEADSLNTRADWLQSEAVRLAFDIRFRIRMARWRAIGSVNALEVTRDTVRRGVLDRAKRTLSRIRAVTRRPDGLVIAMPMGPRWPDASLALPQANMGLAVGGGVLAATVGYATLSAFGLLPAATGAGMASVGGAGAVGGLAAFGLLAGPAIAITGVIMASNARERLAHARQRYAYVEAGVAECEVAIAVLGAVASACSQIDEYTRKMADRCEVLLAGLEEMLEWSGTDYNKFDLPQRQYLHAVLTSVQALRALLDARYVEEDGNASGGYFIAVRDAHRLLEGS